ncbi:hypothetical protein THAOC_24949 [Thalassiosira oceanica]|uniref:Uncharacterized protein n=1 Tax=Thalassiosira oceanica TaxID=159749 RepID=K0RNJ1_THAOC|nr:hypothetical protein THAOC_24949 [Thalassiosira oceanica]|eukprot:EJK55328.1 hypothetical protein THAOC_24949 [Thalassiosira oceanica]
MRGSQRTRAVRGTGEPDNVRRRQHRGPAEGGDIPVHRPRSGGPAPVSKRPQIDGPKYSVTLYFKTMTLYYNFDVVTTNFGWTTPDRLRFLLRKISGVFFDAVLSHQWYNALACGDLEENPDPSRRVVVFLDVDTCIDGNYPAYSAPLSLGREQATLAGDHLQRGGGSGSTDAIPGGPAKRALGRLAQQPPVKIRPAGRWLQRRPRRQGFVMDHQRAGGDALSSGGVVTDAAATSPGGDKADVPPSERRSSPTAAARKSPWGMGRRDGGKKKPTAGPASPGETQEGNWWR